MRVHENWMADNLCDFFSLFDAANLSYMPMPIRHVHVHIIFCCERMSRAYSTPSIRWQIRYVIARKRKNWEVRLTIHDVDSAQWKNIISTFSARRHRHSHGWTYRAHRQRFFFTYCFCVSKFKQLLMQRKWYGTLANWYWHSIGPLGFYSEKLPILSDSRQPIKTVLRRRMYRCRWCCATDFHLLPSEQQTYAPTVRWQSLPGKCTSIHHSELKCIRETNPITPSH